MVECGRVEVEVDSSGSMVGSGTWVVGSREVLTGGLTGGIRDMDERSSDGMIGGV